jgi:hypothetical protein
VNLIVKEKKPQVEVQKDEFGNREKKRQVEIQKDEFSSKKNKNRKLKFENALILVKFHLNFIVFVDLGFCEKNIS